MVGLLFAPFAPVPSVALHVHTLSGTARLPSYHVSLIIKHPSRACPSEQPSRPCFRGVAATQASTVDLQYIFDALDSQKGAIMSLPQATSAVLILNRSRNHSRSRSRSRSRSCSRSRAAGTLLPHGHI